MLLALVLMLSVAAITASARYDNATPTLTFSGSTANCVATVISDNASDAIQVSLTLRENGTPVAGWNDSGTGRVTMSKTYDATPGATYTLVLNYSINGVKQDPVSVSATCP